MYRCDECGTKINLTNPIMGTIIECDICGIDLEVAENTLISLQLGPSEE